MSATGSSSTPRSSDSVLIRTFGGRHPHGRRSVFCRRRRPYLNPDFGAIRAPWSNGEPQPKIAALIDAGKVLHHGRSRSVFYRNRLARAEATRRGLETATFDVPELTALRGYDGRFSTIIDSALIHSLAAALRDDYQRSIAHASAPGASYFALVFDRAGMPWAPEDFVTAEELRLG